MGFRLNIVITSTVTPDVRRNIFATAHDAWPTIRGPRYDTGYDRRLLFAPPELTTYLFNDDSDYEIALEQCSNVEHGLKGLSQRFPDVTFAYIEADCFGGTCNYCGYCCRAGDVLVVLDEATNNGHVQLLSHVDIVCSGTFPPFGRGFFAGKGSGGYK